MNSCAACGHDEDAHPLRSCRSKDCPCMRFVLDRSHDLPVDGAIGWAGCVMTGIVELVASRTEGVVHVATDDARECVVKITFRPIVPYNSSGGRA